MREVGDWELGLADATGVYRMDRQHGPIVLYRIGNYSQYPVMNHNGKEYEKEDM